MILITKSKVIRTPSVYQWPSTLHQVFILAADLEIPSPRKYKFQHGLYADRWPIK